jgi:hypothetical protein
VAPVRPAWIPVTAAAALLLLGMSALLPWLGTPAVQRVLAKREAQVPEPKLVATAARPTVMLADSLLDPSQDVEFILDPVVLHRGRAQGPSGLPKGVQGERAVISF